MNDRFLDYSMTVLKEMSVLRTSTFPNECYSYGLFHVGLERNVSLHNIYISQ